MPARKTPTRPSPSGTPPKETPKPASKQGGRLFRRELGSAVCFLLAIFTFSSLVGAEAWLLDNIRKGLEFLIGGGFYVFPFICVFAAVILLFHRGRPVASRVVCLFIIPILIGMISAFDKVGTPLSYRLSEVIQLGIGRVVTTVLIIFGIIVCVFVTLRLSLVAIVDAIRSRPRRVYEPQPIPENELPPIPADRPLKPVKPEKAVSRPEIDVPIYVGPDSEPEEPPPVGILSGRGKKTPAEIAAEKPEMPEVPAEPQLAPIPPIGVKVTPVPPPDGQPEFEEKTKVISPPKAAPPPKVEVMPVLEPVASVIVAADETFAVEENPLPYRFPTTSLLTATRPSQESLSSKNKEELTNNAERLVSVLGSFGLGASVVNVIQGPSVARYEIEPDAGVKLTSLTSRADDIALALGAVGVHMAPVPGKANIVGIEVPNRMVSTVYIRDLIDSPEFRAIDSPTAFVLGRDIAGQNIVADIAKLTHLLIAGTTGSGKSVCMNTLITSMLYKASPEDLRFIMVDPKMVELGVYNGIPHLLSPVVTDPKRAAEALAWAVTEMDNRYNLLMQRGKRDIISYNEEVSAEPGGVKMPRIVIIIDEMADLMMVAHKEVETAVARIAQKARACGVHLILATQRPEAKVVTGIIKANTPSRIAFAVKGNLDSRIILDTGGAEKLVGRGDMLYLPIGAPKPLRVQGCYVSDTEVGRVVEYISKTSPANYSEEMLAHLEQRQDSGIGQRDAAPDGGGGRGTGDAGGADPMLPAAIEAIIESGQGSTSYLQRRLKLGYARAARLMDEMEERGIVGPFEGSKPRAVLITPEEWEGMK
jgi:S-DNA-T family DNA segregation ATPase FtsK/SpoIIIE